MNECVGAVLLAADVPRVAGFDGMWASLGGRPVVSHALASLAASEAIDEIVLVAPPTRIPAARRLAEASARSIQVCATEAPGCAGIAAGLRALAGCAWVLVHDGARPFLARDLIERGLEAARVSGAAVAALPARDTVKLVIGASVRGTVPRHELWCLQTPAVFEIGLLQSSLGRFGAVGGQDADEATLVERLGERIRVFPGSETNWRIATPLELELAEALLAFRAANGAGHPAC